MLEQIASRIRQRIDDLGTTQTDVATALGWTQQRFGNYYHGRRMPDVPSLARIARQLETTTDWLVGLSDARTVVAEEVLLELLAASGLTHDRSQLIFDAMLEAMRLLSVLPDEGDDNMRSRMAARAAWHSAGSPRPN